MMHFPLSLSLSFPKILVENTNDIKGCQVDLFVGCGTGSGVTWKLGEVSFSFGIDSDELWDLVHVTGLF